MSALVQTDYVGLRSIVKAFRQGAGGAPSVFADLLEQRIVKSTPARRKYLDKLLALKIVSKDRAHYYLDTRELAKYGVSWESVVDGQPNPAVMKFLRTLENGG
jgi:hypothetical protein